MNTDRCNRRDAIRFSAASLAGATALSAGLPAMSQDQMGRKNRIRVLNPRGRVPLSFIIDDSTCLVNMGHFCTPQFAEAWPQREIYQAPWREWPREIPDSFVREFGEWCAEHDVKGKYSIVPYPACVGWLDRSLPGWSRTDLENSLALVRDLMMPNWDIHTEMITHTRVIDLKTGRPMEQVNASTMENSYPQTDISTDHLTEYLAYSLRILKNCGLDCEGITTPGGFGNRVKDKLPIAVGQAVRDVYSCELPHYFKYVKTGSESTKPRLEYSSDQHNLSNLTINVPAGTGDWFGGWQGNQLSQPDRYCNADATAGRMVELIQRGDPAVMLCHWPGMYCNGTKTGFKAFKRVVESLESRFKQQTLWMKVSEIGRYQAAKELIKLTRTGTNRIEIISPLSCKEFTFAIDQQDLNGTPTLEHQGKKSPLGQAVSMAGLVNGTFVKNPSQTTVCVSIPKGTSRLIL